MNANKTLSAVKIIVLALILGVGVQYAVAQWSSAPANPPSCPDTYPGCFTPINVSLLDQEKFGPLKVNTKQPKVYGLDVFGIARFNGGLVIETRAANPTANLDTGRMWLITN